MPGTISGAEDPDDRLRAEITTHRTPDEGQSPPWPTSTSRAVEGVAFLVLVSFGCLFALFVLTGPIRNGIAALLSAFGVPFIDPATIPGRAWGPVMPHLPAAYFAHIVASQVPLLVSAVTGALFLGGDLRRRLGLVLPRGGVRVLAVAGGLEILTLVFGVAAVVVFLPSDFEPSGRMLEISRMMARAPFGWWLALLLATSVLPGVFEEMLFRGLIQRRLLELWPPAAAILFTGLVFTSLHPPFVRSLMLLPGCLWLGYVAWRCGSILPGIVLHAGTNAGLDVLTRYLPDDDTSGIDAETRWACALIAVVSGGLCAWLLVLLHRWTRSDAAEGAPKSSLRA